MMLLGMEPAVAVRVARLALPRDRFAATSFAGLTGGAKASSPIQITRRIVELFRKVLLQMNRVLTVSELLGNANCRFHRAI
jgi:hypothetical protein